MKEAIEKTDVISVLRQDINRYPLLGEKEQKTLTIRLAKGRLFLNGSKRLEQMSLSEDAKEAFETLVNSNLRLVAKFAKKYSWSENSFLDNFQNGSEGLMVGLAKFEPDKGYVLSTYVTWWIRQKILRGIADTARTIRVPVHVNDRIQSLYKQQERLSQYLGRTATDSEMADEINMDVNYLKELRQIADTPISLDRPLDNQDSDSETTGSFIEDNSTPVEETVLSQLTNREEVKKILSLLDQREKIIILYRNGLIDGEAHTLEETASNFNLNLTRERVRQIEASAVDKIKSRPELWEWNYERSYRTKK